jgi:integrase
MTPYRKKGKKTWYLTLATGAVDEAGKAEYVRPTSGTRDRATADEMQAMLNLIGKRGKRWFWLRDAIVAKRVDVPVAYDHYVSGTLDALQAQLADLDLRPFVKAWEGHLDAAVADGTMAAETVRKYKAEVVVLFGSEDPVWRSTVTAKFLKAKLAAVPGSGTNRRRHAAAWSSCLDYCVEHEAIESNPLRGMKLPKSNKAKERYLDWPLAVRLIHAMPEGAHRALSALRHGAGLEMVAALRMTRRDVVDPTNRVVWAHGSKNDHRDRQALVLDEDCWSIFWRYVQGGGFLPDAKLFPFSSRVHGDMQNDVAKALREEEVAIRDPYPLHASRSTFAVEMKRRGYEDKLIATNLGHANERLVQTVYGKFAPRTEDLIRSAKRAAATAEASR